MFIRDREGEDWGPNSPEWSDKQKLTEEEESDLIPPNPLVPKNSLISLVGESHAYKDIKNSNRYFPSVPLPNPGRSPLSYIIYLEIESIS